MNRKVVENKLIGIKFGKLYGRIQHSKEENEITTRYTNNFDNLDEVAILFYLFIYFRFSGSIHYYLLYPQHDVIKVKPHI